MYHFGKKIRETRESVDPGDNTSKTLRWQRIANDISCKGRDVVFKKKRWELGPSKKFSYCGEDRGLCVCVFEPR